MRKKRVRILLRVSSDQQLDKNGDLTVQRTLIMDYILTQTDWELDTEKEYFEGSNSGYKNSVADRDVLQEAYNDAKKQEYDILVIYKDDRLGRKIQEIPEYIMSLKKFGVDVYSVKDGLLSPEIHDYSGKMMLYFRYGMAEKSSYDTGLRVKDTAQKLVEQGKFMGGKAPYGYKLDFSGEISKHGRALKHPVIVPEQAEVVKYIYTLSLHKEFGSSKIASTLNNDAKYRHLAPNDIWKAGTITSILTNPIYAGYTAYKRREKIDGKYRSLNNKDWIYAKNQNTDITIIDKETWEKVQIKRTQRRAKYTNPLKNQNIKVITRNDGMLALIDVLHCGYCGCKMTNGSKYNYWKLKNGEQRASKKPIYRCHMAQQGVPHNKTKQVQAEIIEPIIFQALAEYISKLQENEDTFDQILHNQNKEKKINEKMLAQEKQKLKDIQNDRKTLEYNVPKAMTGNYAFSVEDLASFIQEHKKQEQNQIEIIQQMEFELKNDTVSIEDWESIRSKIPTWKDLFLNADTASKRVLVNKLIERIDFKKDEIAIYFKISLENVLPQSRMTNNESVSE